MLRKCVFPSWNDVIQLFWMNGNIVLKKIYHPRLLDPANPWLDDNQKFHLKKLHTHFLLGILKSPLTLGDLAPALVI